MLLKRRKYFAHVSLRKCPLFAEWRVGNKAVGAMISGCEFFSNKFAFSISPYGMQFYSLWFGTAPLTRSASAPYVTIMYPFSVIAKLTLSLISNYRQRIFQVPHGAHVQ